MMVVCFGSLKPGDKFTFTYPQTGKRLDCQKLKPLGGYDMPNAYEMGTFGTHLFHDANLVTKLEG